MPTKTSLYQRKEPQKITYGGYRKATPEWNEEVRRGVVGKKENMIDSVNWKVMKWLGYVHVYRSQEVISFQCLVLAVTCDVTHMRAITGSVHMETDPVIGRRRLMTYVNHVVKAKAQNCCKGY